MKNGTKKGIIFEPNDILYGKLRPYLNNWLLADFTGVAVGDFWVFRSIYLPASFLYYLIQGDVYQTVANISSGTKMPRSNWSLVSNTIFQIPEKAEADIIGNFFLNIEKYITLHQ